jgi:N-acetylneuraminic acid mutarotase
MKRLSASAFLLLGLVSCSGTTGSSKTSGPPPKTQITSAKVQGNSLLISATNFGSGSTVTLGGTPLKLGSAKATEITAVLPEAFGPGTYLLTVSGGTPVTTDSFAVTIGATGPPGPPGAAGASSPQFPPGYSIMGESPTPPKGFTYTGYSVISQGESTGWTLKAPMSTPRILHGMAVVNGIVYVIGGAKDKSLQSLSTVEAYDPSKDAWTTKAPMPTARFAAGIGVLGGSIYVIGGSEKADAFTGTFEIYSPATDKWTTKTPIPTPKKGVVTAVMNGRLYVLGDFASFNASQTEAAPGMEVYDPATDAWTQKAGIPTARSNFSVAVVNGLLYAIGGTAESPLTLVQAYDPQTNTWTTKAPMPSPRKGFALGVINGIIYLTGGSGDSGPLGTTIAYDPMHDAWSNSLTLPIAVDMPGGATGDEGTLYVTGGIQDAGKGVPSLQVFSPSGVRFYVYRSQ